MRSENKVTAQKNAATKIATDSSYNKLLTISKQKVNTLIEKQSHQSKKTIFPLLLYILPKFSACDGFTAVPLTPDPDIFNKPNKLFITND